MAKRYTLVTKADNQFSEAMSALPTDYPIAVYYRQSTDSQVGNISTSIQTVDMVAYLQARGWAENDIHLIDMDAGVSGTTKIDEREGMRTMFKLIVERKIRAVACQDEDRLFRDITQIQVNIFIEACKTANVQVITPVMVYDFAHPTYGTFHARQFRFKSEMAAEYITSVIIGKLHRSKERLLQEGRWAGQNILPGFMVDIRKILPDGSVNPNWKRYVEFADYAEIVREYFRIFLAHAGNVGATLKHIHRLGPFYPDPKKCIPPEGYKAVYGKMQLFGGGYAPGRSGLENLLTNVNLLGHWTVRNSVVRWNNHPPIVEEKVFWQAFNYLSSINVDGSPNMHYRPFCQNARPSRDEDRPFERPLLAGMIFGKIGDDWRKVGSVWDKGREEYIYTLMAHREEYVVWRRKAVFVDNAVVALVHGKLRATFSQEIWSKTLIHATEEFEEERKRISAQLSHLEQVKQNFVLSLETLTNPELIQAVQIRFQDAQNEHDRLSRELSQNSELASRIEALEQIRNSAEPTISQWDNLTRDEKRQIFHTFIKRTEAKIVDGTGLEVTVRWIDNSTDTVVLPKLADTGWRWWLDSETKLLFELLGQNASQVEIAAAFPNRKWKMIAAKIYNKRGCQWYVPSPRPIRHDETYHEFLKRTSDNQSYVAYSGDHWNEEAIAQLLHLYDIGASRLEIMKVFPHRKWKNIAKKIRQLRGGNTTPTDEQFPRDETYNTYMQRVNKATKKFGHSKQHGTGLSTGSRSR